MKARMPDHAVMVAIHAAGMACVRLSVPLLTAISIVTRMPRTKPSFGLNCIVDLLHFDRDETKPDVAHRNAALQVSLSCFLCSIMQAFMASRSPKCRRQKRCP